MSKRQHHDHATTCPLCHPVYGSLGSPAARAERQTLGEALTTDDWRTMYLREKDHTADAQAEVSRLEAELAQVADLVAKARMFKWASDKFRRHINLATGIRPEAYRAMCDAAGVMNAVNHDLRIDAVLDLAPDGANAYPVGEEGWRLAVQRITEARIRDARERDALARDRNAAREALLAVWTALGKADTNMDDSQAGAEVAALSARLEAVRAVLRERPSASAAGCWPDYGAWAEGVISRALAATETKT